jgi:hypothetical protein
MSHRPDQGKVVIGGKNLPRRPVVDHFFDQRDLSFDIILPGWRIPVNMKPGLAACSLRSFVQ